jgi:hypothetical protein
MKAPKGTVGIETHHGWLRLRLPRTVTTGSSRYFSLGLQDTPDNRKKAQVIAWDIETDIQGGLLRPLGSYLAKPPVLAEVRSLTDLWQLFLEFVRRESRVLGTRVLNDWETYLPKESFLLVPT